MRSYRLYSLDQTTRMESAEWLDARSDDEAIILARTKKLPMRCELWDKNRLVANIEPRVQG